MIGLNCRVLKNKRELWDRLGSFWNVNERWTRVAGPGEDVRKVKAALLPGHTLITFCGSKRSGKSTGLTAAAQTVVGGWYANAWCGRLPL